MQNIRLPGRRMLISMLCLLLIIVLIYAGMCMISGVNPASYKYKSYMLQAQAWLRGEFALDRNYEYLELAVYNDQYYVSFPPVPTIPMVIYTLIFGDQVPGGLFQKIYIAMACMIVLAEIQRSKRMKPIESIAWALLICLGSAMLPITLVGGVWYEAQILAFLFSVAAIAAMRRGRIILCCICYALSVGCRPFSVVLGPVLLMMYLESARSEQLPPKRILAKLIPGLAAGLAIAAGYAIYNYARFGNPFEFGHNYLPEFTRSEHGQLSLKYVASNWKTLFFGAPFSADGNQLSINQFGFSMFLSCPIFICNSIWLVQDILRRRMCPTKWMILIMSALNVLLLLMHRTLGGHQFGARYALELVPMCFAWYLLSPDRHAITRWESVLMVFGFIFNFVGGCLIHV